MELGVCSWSLQVTSVPELEGLMSRLGCDLVQIACGDPHHASWDEGDAMPAAAKAAGFRIGGAMLGFPGEDYTTPETIRKTGGFGDPATRPGRLERFRWAVARTKELGLGDLMLHAGFIPEAGDAGRPAFLDTLGEVSRLADGVTVAFETGQESADLLKLTLDELKCDNLRVNFDPANMLLYDAGDPLAAVQTLAGFIHSVHLKDAFPPETPGTWGREVPLGQGRVNIPAFVAALRKVGYGGPLFVEREVGDQQQRVADIEEGLRVARAALAG